MDLKKYIDNIESICSTCETCDTSCAGNMFKSCLKSELEVEEVYQHLNNNMIQVGSSDTAVQIRLF